MQIKARWYRVLVVLALLVLTPVTFSLGDGFDKNTVCGEGSVSCVRQIGSVCTVGEISKVDEWLM